jgi:hypothetical protein
MYEDLTLCALALIFRFFNSLGIVCAYMVLI